MDLEQLRKQLEIDEGITFMKFILTILVFALLALFHLVIESDPENGQEVGTPVSKDRVIDAFEQDVQTVLSDCAILKTHDEFRN